ncbi:MAG TPA: CocE/NonD family hydrolase C-terminal non-catalytic domain-containing protein [Actinoplanes sp.]
MQAAVGDGQVEARPDVLIYTTDTLSEDVEIIGEVGAQIWLRSSLAHADVFVRLCDVDERGRSTNVRDGPGQRDRSGRAVPGDGAHVADRLPVPARAPHPRPGFQRRVPSLQPQLRQR